MNQRTQRTDQRIPLMCDLLQIVSIPQHHVEVYLVIVDYFERCCVSWNQLLLPKEEALSITHRNILAREHFEYQREETDHLLLLFSFVTHYLSCISLHYLLRGNYITVPVNQISLKICLSYKVRKFHQPHGYIAVVLLFNLQVIRIHLWERAALKLC